MSSSQCCSSPDIKTHVTKKRRWSPPKEKNIVDEQQEGAGRQRGRPRGKKASLSARNEIHLLREQVTSMEEELHGLHTKWAKYQPDDRALTAAQHSARKKYEIAQARNVHKQLQKMILHQQLVFATLQSAILRAPMHSSGNTLFKALHFDTRLGHGPDDRIKTLETHNERSLATLPSIVNQCTQTMVDKVLKYKDQATRTLSTLPISQIDVTGCADCTLVTSVFISEIPHTSLQDVYAGVVAFFDTITTSLKCHFGIHATRTKLNGVEAAPAYCRMDLERSSGFPAAVNQVMCSELTASHGIVHIDAVTEDPLHPSNPTEFDICGLTITPRKAPGTDRIVSVTLRWVVVYRYDMLPNDPLLQKHVEFTRPILNGDLITASVCHFLQERRALM